MSQDVSKVDPGLRELAEREGVPEELIPQLERTVEIFAKNPDYAAILTDDELMEQIGAYLKESIEANNAEQGIVTARATSAVPLTEDQRERLCARLSQMFDGAQIDLRVSVDPSVIGGVRLDVGGQRYDGTVERRLADMRQALA